MEDYLNKNCPRNLCYIIYTAFDEIFEPYEKNFCKEDINHVFFFNANKEKKMTISLFIAKNILYLLNNKLIVLNGLNELVKNLSGSQLKYLYIDKTKYMKLNNSYDENKWNQLNIYKKNDNKLDNTYILNLTNNHNFNGNILYNENDINNKFIDTIIINNNFKLNDLSFINKFSYLKSLDIWNMPSLINDNIDSINKYCRNLEIINIHFCPNLNIRILISLYKMKNLKKILIDDSFFYCQYDMDKLFITNDEWRNIISETIIDIVINSENMNMDIADYIFKSTPYLKSITLCKNIHNMCM